MKLTTIFLSLFMLFKPMIVVVEYVVLYDYITQELCVNKQQEDLQCNGKCYLSKQLTKAFDTEQTDKKSGLSWSLIGLSFVEKICDYSIFTPVTPYGFKVFIYPKNNYFLYIYNSLFRPPV
ncbi:hypothetical protein ACYSNV_04070 [Myroides sp. LJL119]